MVLFYSPLNYSLNMFGLKEFGFEILYHNKLVEFYWWGFLSVRVEATFLRGSIHFLGQGKLFALIFKLSGPPKGLDNDL